MDQKVINRKDSLKIKVKGQTVQAGEHGQTDGRTDRQTLPNVLSPLLRGR